MIIDDAINMYFSPSKYKQRKELIRFIKASVKLYYRIDEVLNRVDVLHAAFILCMCEYDIYKERITADLASRKVATVKKIRKYIIDDIVSGYSLNVYGNWGKIEDAYNDVSVLVLGGETDDDYWMAPKPQRGRPRKQVKLGDRINWGAQKIHKLISDYKKHYQPFYN